jgi:HD-GYP domain-containing protein (c-di-GMP phosphodiesterase class II)
MPKHLKENDPNRPVDEAPGSPRPDLIPDQDSSELLSRLTRIGFALSAEKNIDRLLEMIVDEAKKFTNANGGTLYVTSEDETELQFAIIQNDTLHIRMGGTGEKISWPPVKLKNPDQSPNYMNVSAYSALTGNVVNIEDVYHATGFNFEGTRRFDDQTGYQSISMLVVPMKNHDNDIIGVLQLLNAQDPTTGTVRAFSPEEQQVTESLASQAAVALSNNLLIHSLEDLLESFIETIATAIDEKSPYTGGHVRRVAELTLTIADRINTVREGPYADQLFSEEQIEELRVAAWLHDIGKITTPEHVVNKSTKLETIVDRIDLIKARFEIMKRDREIASLKKTLLHTRMKEAVPVPEEEDAVDLPHDDLLRFIERMNLGVDFVNAQTLEQLQSIADWQWQDKDTWRPLLTENELYNLSVRQGTLTDEERAIIESHALITHGMLSKLPFPKKFRNVPFLAASHHEKLDGTGYPHGLKDAQLPLQARILALADIFEALTATDRPYKKGNTLSGAIRIMQRMVEDHHIDAELFDLFVREKIHLDYARKELSDWQFEGPER